MAGSVIQATGTVEFEDRLRTGVLPGDCWYTCGAVTSSPGSILHHSVGVGHGDSVVVIRIPVRPNSNSVEFQTWVVLNCISCVVLG